MTAFVPREELYSRIGKLQLWMREEQVDGVLILQRADLYYFSGTGQNAFLYIPAAGEPHLLVRKSMERALEESKLSCIEPFKGLDHLADLVRSYSPGNGKTGLELDVIPANLYLKFTKLFYPHQLLDASKAIRHIRAVKSLFELKQQLAAAALSREMFEFAREIICEGGTEASLAAQLEAFARHQGHQGAIRMRGFNQEMFYGHIMSGESAAAPSFFDGPTGGCGLNPSYPQGAGFNKIKRNEPILIDFVTAVNGYMVDQTRIYCLGKLPVKLEKAYNTALEIKRKLMESGKSGISGHELFDLAASMAAKAGLEENFMGTKDKVLFIGHGVGLELDELPVIAKNFNYTLEENMVFALEPKFVFPGLGAVGIEDTFVVHRECLETISSFDDSIQYI